MFVRFFSLSSWFLGQPTSVLVNLDFLRSSVTVYQTNVIRMTEVVAITTVMKIDGIK